MINDDLPKGLSTAALDELKLEHGEIHIIRHPDDAYPSVLVKLPKRVEYNRFKSEIGNDRKAVSEKALEGFFKRHVVYPSREELEVVLETYPALTDAYGKKLLELIGMSEVTESKKL